VGKTETAHALSELLYSGDDSLITINMSEFQEAHTVSTLKGALERLGMTTLALEFVATHKREKLEQITHSLCPDSAREIT